MITFLQEFTQFAEQNLCSTIFFGDMTCATLAEMYSSSDVIEVSSDNFRHLECKLKDWIVSNRISTIIDDHEVYEYKLQRISTGKCYTLRAHNMMRVYGYSWENVKGVNILLTTDQILDFLYTLIKKKNLKSMQEFLNFICIVNPKEVSAEIIAVWCRFIYENSSFISSLPAETITLFYQVNEALEIPDVYL